MFMGQEDTRKAVSKEEILKLANDLVSKDWEYMDGMHVDDVVQNGEVLVMKGDYFFDEKGLPTLKSNAIFNMFRKVSAILSPQYKISDENK